MARLIAAVGRGVRVRLMLDQVGTMIKRPRQALRKFRAAGGELRMFSAHSRSRRLPAGSTCAITAR